MTSREDRTTGDVRASILPSHGRWGRLKPLPLFAWLVSAVVVVVVLAPLALTVQRVFFPGGSFAGTEVADALTKSHLGVLIRNTVIVVGLGTLGAVVIGCLFAWLNERTDARIGWLSQSLPIMPLFVPQLAMVIGWTLLATPGPGLLNAIYTQLGGSGQGPFNIFGWPGLILLYVLNLVPHVYITVAAAFQNMDPSLEEASRINGAGLFRTLTRVTIPAVRPAAWSGALLAVSAGFALFSVPVIVGTPARIDILTVEIVHMVTSKYPANFTGAMTLGLVIVILVGITWALQRRSIELGRSATITGRANTRSTIPLRAWKWPTRALMLLYLLATVIAPVVALFYVSVQKFWSSKLNLTKITFSNYSELFSGGTRAESAFKYSLLLGVGTAFAAMFVATLIAYITQRSAGGRAARFVDGVSKLPAGLSHVVIAVAILAALGGSPFHLHGTIWILFIGYLVLTLPQATISASSALSQVNKALSEASFTSGAGEGKTLRSVVVPLMVPGLVAGWVLVFVHGVGDLTASVMLASANVPVLGFVMFDLSQDGTFGLLAAMGVIMTLITSTISIGMLMVGKRKTKNRPGLIARVRRSFG